MSCSIDSSDAVLPICRVFIDCVCLRCIPFATSCAICVQCMSIFWSQLVIQDINLWVTSENQVTELQHVTDEHNVKVAVNKSVPYIGCYGWRPKLWFLKFTDLPTILGPVYSGQDCYCYNISSMQIKTLPLDSVACNSVWRWRSRHNFSFNVCEVWTFCA